MAQIRFHGNNLNTNGNLPAIGSQAPAFTLVGNDLSEHRLQKYQGTPIVLNIFPSIDTPTCATSIKRFHQELASHQDVQVLCISVDLPFAQARFCGAEGTDRVTTLSAFRHPEFGFDYGVLITDGALKGLLARAIVVINAKGEVCHTELVKELGSEPDYNAALSAT